MDSELIIVCAVQVFVLFLVLGLILAYLYKNLMLRSRVDVVGKAVLITGCDMPLGESLAMHFDQVLGMKVFAGMKDTSGEAAVRIQADCSSRLQILHCDVTNEESLVAAQKFIKESLPSSEKGLWALINAATYVVCGELEWQTKDHCSRQFQVNFLGVVNTIRTFLPLLKSGKGRIINIGSSAERNNPEPGLAMYSGTKVAVEGLSQALKFELARFGVAVTVIQPDVKYLNNCLLDQHHKKMNEMWNEMSLEQRTEFQEVFISYHSSVAKLDLEDTDNLTQDKSTMPAYLRRCFDDAIFSKCPSDIYVAVPTHTNRIRIGLVACIPIGWREYFIQRKYKHNIAKILKV